jgi:hypothetical protein
MPSLDFIQAPPHTGCENLADSFCLIEHHELLDENDGFHEIQRNGRLDIGSFESDDENLSSEEDECLLRAVEGDGEEDVGFLHHSGLGGVTHLMSEVVKVIFYSRSKRCEAAHAQAYAHA